MAHRRSSVWVQSKPQRQLRDLGPRVGERLLASDSANERPASTSVFSSRNDYEFPGTRRMLFVTAGGYDAFLFTSPDLPAGTAITYYEPDFEVAPFGDALDEFMILRLE